jgi:hypothetical protein
MPLIETIGSASIKGYGFGSGVSRLPLFQSSNLMFFTDPATFSSGDIIYDLSGNGYHHSLINVAKATINGAPCLNLVKVGTSVPADNRRMWIDPAVRSSFQYSTSHTLLAWGWMNPKSSQTSDWRTLWRAQPDDHALLVRYDDNAIGYYDNTNDRTSSAQTGTPGNQFNQYGSTNASSYEGNWRLYVITGSGSYTGTSTLFIDASSVGTVSRTMANQTHTDVGTASDTQQFGYIGEVAVYNRILSGSEITAIYNSTKARYGK